MTSDTRRTGDSSEHFVAAMLTDCGFDVSFPMGAFRYDLVADDGVRLWRVQVKTVQTAANGTISFTMRSSKKQNDTDSQDCGGQIAAFASCDPKTQTPVCQGEVRRLRDPIA